VQQTLTATDVCGAASVAMRVDPYMEDQCGNYDITYRWIASDDCGNETEITRTFSVLADGISPTFDSAPSAISNISCGDPLPVQETLTASDACGTATVTPSVDSYTVNICSGYTITYRWLAEDDCGNTTEVFESFDVLPDTENPNFTVPDDITIGCTQDPNDLGITGEPTNSSDNCSNTGLTPTYADQNQIIVNALGREGVEIFEVEVNGISIGTQLVTQTMTAYSFNTTISPIETIEVIFTNDQAGPGFDADLRVDNIILNEVVYESEDISVFSEGSFDSVSGCGGGFKQSEWINCPGFFRFTFSDEGCQGGIKINRYWTLVDNCGNETTQLQTITIADDVAPTISNVPNDTLVACTVCISSLLNGDFLIQTFIKSFARCQTQL